MYFDQFYCIKIINKQYHFINNQPFNIVNHKNFYISNFLFPFICTILWYVLLTETYHADMLEFIMAHFVRPHDRPTMVAFSLLNIHIFILHQQACIIGYHVYPLVCISRLKFKVVLLINFEKHIDVRLNTITTK